MAKSVVGPWAQDKLERLRKYLNVYTTIMKEQRWCQGYHYIDAFAGPGEHEIRGDSTDKGRLPSRHCLMSLAMDPSRKNNNSFWPAHLESHSTYPTLSARTCLSKSRQTGSQHSKS